VAGKIQMYWHDILALAALRRRRTLMRGESRANYIILSGRHGT
jgi:hypothetical protein